MLTHYSPLQERWAERNAELLPEAADGSAKMLEPAEKVKRFLTFSTGPRQCIGQSLARMLHDVGIAMLYGRYTFRLAPQVCWDSGCVTSVGVCMLVASCDDWSTWLHLEPGPCELAYTIDNLSRRSC